MVALKVPPCSGQLSSMVSCAESQLGFQGSSEGTIATTALCSNMTANNWVPSSIFPGLFFQHRP